jgi:tetratricopeptide (TPR) repeat protein
MMTAKPTYDDPEKDPAAKEKLYPELARANLLRMRGDYKGAIDQCLSILKRMPEDLDAHTLIGDIYSESGDLVQSAQWYDLALELDPSSHALRSKLEAVRERAQHKEIAETAEQLGLPTDGPRMAIYSAVIVILIVVIGITAYLLGQRHPVAKRSPLHISINAPGIPDRPTDAPNADGDDTSGALDSSASAAGAGYLPQEDRTLTLALSQRDPLGSHIMSAMSDPRTKLLTINYSVRADEDVRKIGAELARSSFDQAPDAMTITVRATRDDKLVYVADVSRDKLNDAVANNESQGGSSDAWISGALSYEWTPAPASGSAPAAANGQAATPSTAPPASTPPSTYGTSGASPAPSTPKDSGAGTAGNATGGT